jgi:hypothetical protein
MSTTTPQRRSPEAHYIEHYGPVSPDVRRRLDERCPLTLAEIHTLEATVGFAPPSNLLPPDVGYQTLAAEYELRHTNVTPQEMRGLARAVGLADQLQHEVAVYDGALDRPECDRRVALERFELRAVDRSRDGAGA